MAATPSRRPAVPAFPEDAPARLLPALGKAFNPTPSSRCVAPGTRDRSARSGDLGPSPPHSYTTRAPAPVSCGLAEPRVHAVPLGTQQAACARRPSSRLHHRPPRLAVRRAPPSAAARRDDVVAPHWPPLQGPGNGLSHPDAPPLNAPSATIGCRLLSPSRREIHRAPGAEPVEQHGAAAGRADTATGVGTRILAAARATAGPGTGCPGAGG